MNTVTISSKYQVVIPRPIRERFNLKPGQKIMFIPYKNTLRVVIVPPIEAAEGLFEGIDSDPGREKVDRE
jgi:AbrB family looped-hinge helix DNA binding protein